MKAYEAYKDSGVEWLGRVPEGWELHRFKKHLTERDARSESGDETLLSVSAYTGVRPRADGLEDGEFLSRAESLQGYKVTYAGDLVMNIMLAWNRAQGITQFDGIVSPAYAVFECDESFDAAYLNHLVRSDEYCLYFKAFSAGVIDSRLRLYPEKFGGLYALMPPLSEQREIAAFLDREVAKIDDLIAEQQRLIALLAEKRQATISHAVTKGLDPTAKLKPSGIDWLGDIPEGWEVRRFKDICIEIVDCKNRTPDPVDESEYFVVRTSCVRDGKFDPSGGYYTDEGSFIEWTRKGLPQVGDVLFTREAPAGEACAAPDGLRFCLGQRMMYLRPNTLRILPEYLLSSVYGPLVREVVEGSARGSTVSHLRVGEVGELRCVCPPIEEQVRIAAFLEEQFSLFNDLSEQADIAIILLQERRAALISAAVTGKIDVRGAITAPAKSLPPLEVSALVLGVVIADHLQQDGFGRMMTQKYLFLIQTSARVHEIGGNFLRDAAGPYDGDLRKRAEKALEKVGLVRVSQDGGHGSRVEYEFLGDAVALRADLAAVLGDRMERFNYLSSRLGRLNKKEIEAVATLYGAWNDFLIDGHTPGQDEIIREVLENWHEEKPKKFTADELKNWLGWMERQDIVPDGTGPKTQRGRLFV